MIGLLGVDGIDRVERVERVERVVGDRYAVVGHAGVAGVVGEALVVISSLAGEATFR
jgi:hypothetical protein